MIHCPGGVDPAHCLMRDTIAATESTPESYRSRHSTASTARLLSLARWTWQSVSPGMAVRPSRSMTRVEAPASGSISRVEPTATIFPSLTATAWATASRASMVNTRPLRSNRSAAST